MTKSIFLLLSLLVISVSWIAEALAQKPEQTFRIGVSDQSHYPLFDFSNDDDKGLAHKILSLFAEKNNFKFEYVAMNYVKLQDAIEKGDIDFIFPDNPSWRAYRYKREHNIYSLPFMQAVSSTFVSTKHKDIEIDQVTSVAIPFGYSPLTWYAAIDKYNIETLTTSDLYASIQSLYRGNVLAADIEYNVAKHLIKVLPNLDAIVVNKNLPSSPTNYHLSTVKHILMLERFSYFVSKHQQQIDDLRKQSQIKNYKDVFGRDGSGVLDSWLELEE